VLGSTEALAPSDVAALKSSGWEPGANFDLMVAALRGLGEGNGR
jgi:hypothetical protein